MTDDDQEQAYWIVVFVEGEKPYTYNRRTEQQMIDMVKANFAKKHVFPWRVWVIENGEMVKVTIT